MIAAKILKGLGIAGGGVLGLIIGLVLLMAIWVGLGFVVAVFPAWIAMLILGAFHVNVGYTLVWLITTGVFMLFGV